MSGKGPQSRTCPKDYERKIKEIMTRCKTLPKPHIAAVAFFDMPGSTNMMKRNPRKAIPAMLHHNATCRMIIESNDGRVVKELGDGLMVRFTHVGDAVTCAFLVIRCLREHAGRMRTKVSVAYGTVWDIENQQGDRDVYGTPVHKSHRMSEHAVEDTILIEEKDKAYIAEWLGGSDHAIRRVHSKIRSYPDARAYRISVH